MKQFLGTEELKRVLNVLGRPSLPFKNNLMLNDKFLIDDNVTKIMIQIICLNLIRNPIVTKILLIKKFYMKFGQQSDPPLGYCLNLSHLLIGGIPK